MTVSTGDAIRLGFWGACGAACFYGVLYLAGAGLAAIAVATKPASAKTAAVKSDCGCGCGGK
jgi:hypothetical protein